MYESAIRESLRRCYLLRQFWTHAILGCSECWRMKCIKIIPAQWTAWKQSVEALLFQRQNFELCSWRVCGSGRKTSQPFSFNVVKKTLLFTAVQKLKFVGTDSRKIGEVTTDMCEINLWPFIWSVYLEFRYVFISIPNRIPRFQMTRPGVPIP